MIREHSEFLTNSAMILRFIPPGRAELRQYSGFPNPNADGESLGERSCVSVPVPRNPDLPPPRFARFSRVI